MSQNGKLMPNLDQQSTKLLNLTVLQRIDPFVEEILITATHVTFYKFDTETSQWVCPFPSLFFFFFSSLLLILCFNYTAFLCLTNSRVGKTSRDLCSSSRGNQSFVYRWIVSFKFFWRGSF